MACKLAVMLGPQLMMSAQLQKYSCRLLQEQVRHPCITCGPRCKFFVEKQKRSEPIVRPD
jgi:hypothetical protein